MATPRSQIARHPQAAVVDTDGDTFPSGSKLYLTNVCSDGHQSLSLTPEQKAAYTHFTQDTADRKWRVEIPDENDRTLIHIRSEVNGNYLGSSTDQYGSSLCLSTIQFSWFVYQGAQPNSFWLSTTQGPDRFMHTWNCNGNDNADVCIFTNQDQKSGRFYGLPYDAWEEFTTGLSWYFEPTPEHREWKKQNVPPKQPRQRQQQSQQQQQQPPNPDLEKQRQALEARAKSLDDRESSLQKRESALQPREASTQAAHQKAQDIVSSAEKRSADLDKREADLQKRADALTQREARATTAETQLKKSRNAKPAEHLALQQELDKAQESNAGLQSEVEGLKAQVKDLQALAATARGSSAAAAAGAPGLVGLGRRGAAGVGGLLGPVGNAVDVPLRKVPERVLPQRVVPGKAVARAFDEVMLRRFREGKKIVSDV